ncbi:MAG TPA: hypothetical protein VFJ05_03465, partial [Nitrososphaeraceae archaeon]|nr:hypothetical protein [Nitrososphaeraceae archaeon]
THNINHPLFTSPHLLSILNVMGARMDSPISATIAISIMLLCEPHTWIKQSQVTVAVVECFSKITT